MMDKNSYDGKPIDMSWKDSPWMNDGETVDVHDSEGDGEMKTTDWPEGATPKEELTERQIEVIKVAAKNPDIDSPSKLAELCDREDVGRTYPQSVIRRNWPERYWVDESNNNNAHSSRRAVPDSDIENIRRMALNGLKAGEIADKRDLGKSTIQGYLNGSRGDDSKSSIPPLEYSQSETAWVLPSGHDGPDREELEPSSETDSASVGGGGNTTADKSNNSTNSNSKIVAIVAFAFGLGIALIFNRWGESE